MSAPFQPVLNSRPAAFAVFFTFFCPTLYGFAGVPALGLGAYALVRMHLEPGRWRGAAGAWFAVVCGALFTLLHPLGMAFYAFLQDKILDVLEFRAILGDG
jgi:hypothetical protein